jgi:hypothetical protein
MKYCKHIHKTIIKLIILALTEWRLTPTPQRPAFVTPQFYDLFEQQSTIGWNHIIHGRFSTLWNTTQTSISNKVPATWLTYIIRNIYHHKYEIWKNRCDINIGTTPQDRRRRELLRITPRLHQLYSKKSKIAPTDIDTIYNYTFDEILLLPTPTIEKWIYQANTQINASINRQTKQTKSSNKSIRQFFQRIVTTASNNKQPTIQPQHNTSITKNMTNFIFHPITTFFPPKSQYPDPQIPIKKSDYRPP